MEKNKSNTTRACIQQSKETYYSTKTKARFRHLLRHPAWKRKGPILVPMLRKLVTYLLKTLTHLLTAPAPTQATRHQKQGLDDISPL